MTSTIPTASVFETAFPCPHCGAYAKQNWSNTFGDRIRGKSAMPHLPDLEVMRRKFKELKFSNSDEANVAKNAIAWAEKMEKGEPFVEAQNVHSDFALHNVFISECFNCGRPAIWIHDRLLYPPSRSGAAPNSDLPPDILFDYEEARTILDLSPRGAAALLRLCVQKLCIHLGEKGNNINDDIASLISKGLDPMIGEALDAVRVIGNEAVHPGSMNIADDRSTAAELFDVINAIADHTLSRPKRLKAIYDRLPEDKRKSFDDRNAKARKVDGKSH